MANERIESWIEQKLDEGVDRKRLKKVLRESGRDPSVVDEVEDPFETAEQADEEEASEEHEDAEEDQSDSGLDLPRPSLPEVSPPDLTGLVHARKFKLSMAALLAVLMVFGGVTMFEPEEEPMSREEIRETAEEGCPDIGVRINSISFGSNSEVSAEVTGGPASVVVELYRGPDLIESVYARFNGRKKLTVPADGNRAIIRPVGCYRLQDEVALG